VPRLVQRKEDDKMGARLMQSFRPVLSAALVLALAGAVAAQTVEDPHKIGPILTANAEINLLVEIVPLELSKEQCTKIAGILEASHKKWETEAKALAAKEAQSLKKIEKLVMDAHDKALKGELPGEEYFEKYGAVISAGAYDRENLRRNSAKNTAASIKEVLTDEQHEKCVEAAKKVIKEQSGGKELDEKVYTENSMFWYFVENVFMAEQCPELLKKLAE
jgi:hypothetical protein